MIFQSMNKSKDKKNRYVLNVAGAQGFVETKYMKYKISLGNFISK